MKIEEAINNLKHGKRIPYKHETLTMAIKSLEAWSKIKEEIKGIDENPDYKPIGIYDYVRGSEDCRKVVLEIIDKHLSEVSE